jgi:hypothetical protein
MRSVYLFFLGIVAMLAVGSYYGQLASAICISILASGIGGLTAALIGILVLTNFFRKPYESAFNRSFLCGTALVAVVIAAWTAVLDLMAGGTTTGLAANLWHVAPRVALTSFAIAVITFGTWLSLVFSQRRSDPNDKPF